MGGKFKDSCHNSRTITIGLYTGFKDFDLQKIKSV